MDRTARVGEPAARRTSPRPPPRCRPVRDARRAGRGAARLLLAGGLWAAALAGGCGPDVPPGLPSDSVYVEAMARLLEVRQAPGARDSARADSLRRAALAELGVTEEALETYTLHYGSEPKHMEAVWRAVARKRADPDASPQRP